MILTVEDVLKLEPLADAKVAAGIKGLSNVVSSVSVIEVPKVTTFTKEGQLEISAFYSIANNVDAQLELVCALKECKASGLILSHVGIILDSVHTQLIDLCNKLDFPLILASPNVAYFDIISPILDKLLQIHNQKLAHAMRIYDKMTNLMLEEKDFDDIIAALSRMISRRVCFFNYNNICVSSSHGELSSEYTIYIKQCIQEYLSRFINEKKDIYINLPEIEGAIILAPVVSSMMYYGVMVVFDASELSELDSISIAQTKNALGIITLNKINLKDYNILLKHDYINDLVTWNFTDEETALQRGVALGYDVSKIRISMVLDIFNFSEMSLQYAESKIQKIKTTFYNTVQNELSYFAPDSIMINFSDKVLILFSMDKDLAHTKERILKIGEQLKQTISKTIAIPVSVGIGGYYDHISEIRTSYSEALSALRISNRIFGSPRCTTFEEVQVYSHIHDILDPIKSREIVNSLLSPIIEYDEENNSDLLTTFKMLISCDMDTLTTAKNLYLHKNTVLQRKNKISKLFKYDPFSAPYLLQFQIAAIIDTLFGV